MSTSASNMVKLLENRAMDLVEFFGGFPAETKAMDPRVWQHILAYVPREAIEAHLKRKDELAKKEA